MPTISNSIWLTTAPLVALLHSIDVGRSCGKVFFGVALRLLLLCNIFVCMDSLDCVLQSKARTELELISQLWIYNAHDESIADELILKSAKLTCLS